MTRVILVRAACVHVCATGRVAAETWPRPTGTLLRVTYDSMESRRRAQRDFFSPCTAGTRWHVCQIVSDRVQIARDRSGLRGLPRIAEDRGRIL